MTNCVKCYWPSSKTTGFSHVEVTGVYDKISFSGVKGKSCVSGSKKDFERSHRH